MVTRRNQPVIVSTEWLQKNLSLPGLIAVDIRSVEEYDTGHIPGAASAPFPLWVTDRDGLRLEVPDDKDLLATIGGAGLGSDSTVVVINRTDTDFDRADATRVAWTLNIAGISNSSVLNGGFNKWLADGRALSSEKTVPPNKEYRGTIDRSSIVSKSYVRDRIGKSTIVDTRSPEDFFGITVADFAPRAGHISSAVLLPAPWVYDAGGTFKSLDVIEAMAKGVLGQDKLREIIVYCGVGGYTSTWVFLLTQAFGYENVRFYDGSMQDWSMDQEGPVTVYSWL
jgi:thiosulfate/3-mercaptopyruvate sulfurtransferase